MGESTPDLECNLVLKGGVMSGVVYARAVGGLREDYRFRGIAGSFAGAIAAAFVAAAEYGRQGGDPAAFDRLLERCEALPRLLAGFFRAEPPFRRLLAALFHLAPGTGRARFGAAALCFWRPLLFGAIAGAGAIGVFYAVIGLRLDGQSVAVAAPGLVLAGSVGAVAWLLSDLAMTLFITLPRANFGLCTGRSGGSKPAVTDWIHDALQEIAFGAAGRAEPLTFSDLSSRGIDLRVIATDLSHARMEILPAFSNRMRFRPAAWARLFSPAVLVASGSGPGDGFSSFSSPDGLPVLVAVRMSMACPGLFEAVPVWSPAGEQLLMVDGGVSQNFPIDIFDSPAAERPTLAFDLATLHSDRLDRITRVSEGLATHDRPSPLSNLRQFLWALIVALREGANRSALTRAPHRERTFQVWLAPDEGGMNLTMRPPEILRLMAYGEDLAAHVLRWRGVQRQDRDQPGKAPSP